MAKVVIHATITLDGYIAGPNDDMSWMSDFFGPNEVARRVVNMVGAILSGGRLFRSIEGELEKYLPYGGEVKAPVYILTHTPRDPITMAGVDFHFVTEGFESAIEQAKASAGDKNVMLFGSTMARLGLEAGVVDEIQLHLVPILLNDGVRLFDQIQARYIKLEKMEAVDSPKVTNLRYKVIK
jgi:dihydrofolate reductase